LGVYLILVNDRQVVANEISATLVVQ